MVEEEKQRRLVAEAWCRMGQGEKEQSDEEGGGGNAGRFFFLSQRPRHSHVPRLEAVEKALFLSLSVFLSRQPLLALSPRVRDAKYAREPVAVTSSSRRASESNEPGLFESRRQPEGHRKR